MFVKAFSLASLLTASLLFAGCGGPADDGGAAGQTIDMKDFKFSPMNVTVKVGTKVTWINKDATTSHTVTSNGTSSPLNSGTIGGGAKYSYTFTMAGTFNYHCIPHQPGMWGRVVVTA